jgi:hypothetical protein
VRWRCRRRGVCVGLLLALTVSPVSASAQDEPPVDHARHQGRVEAPSGWALTADANVFIGRNEQRRLLADYAALESQNWFMLGAAHPAGAGRLTFMGMVSLEPFTIDQQGSPQLFQTGESYRGIPLVHRQHPHDLIMGLGATWTIAKPRVTYTLGADLVGSATLGPVPFMHRESARDNPQVPLTHHMLDSTHITAGVIRVGVTIGAFTFEGSGFRGAEPDDDRLNIEAPRIDSGAARVWWRRGPWEAQFSGGHLRQPEWFEPFDATRLTASIGYQGPLWGRPATMTLAWGQNRQFNGFNGVSDGFLLEGETAVTRSSLVYARVEEAAKEVFGVAPHSKADVHRHWFSEIVAMTAGYIYDVHANRFGRFGVGADVTMYRMQQDLDTYYLGSRSFHVFVRWRRDTGAPASHVH